MQLSDNQVAFLALVRAGLWERDVELRNWGTTDYSQILQLATEQSVVGLVAAGIEHVKDEKIPQEWALQFIGQTLQIEQRNKTMNLFIAEAVEKMREVGIYGLLVKGSGLAQCYERPQWRPCGDIDFFFSKDEFPKAVEFFTKWDGARVVQDAHYTKSFGVVIEPWFIEIHGTLRNGLSSKMDREIDAVQDSLFYGGDVRSWQNGKTRVFLPAADEDVFLVFVHFVRHFYKEGVNIRQICDWCRLLYRYHGELDLRVLESRIRRAGLMEEWRAFAVVAVEYLGMPVEAMPMFPTGSKSQVLRRAKRQSRASSFKKKAEKIVSYILKGGEWKKWRDTLRVARIFPWNTLRFAPGILLNVNWMKVKERLLRRELRNDGTTEIRSYGDTDIGNYGDTGRRRYGDTELRSAMESLTKDEEETQRENHLMVHD